jgi:hypothetical protein
MHTTLLEAVELERGSVSKKMKHRRKTLLQRVSSKMVSTDSENTLTQQTAERKRRQAIAECMQVLKDLIPDNSKRPDIQQVTVLANTVNYIQNVSQLLREIEAQETDQEQRMKIRALLANLPVSE